MLLGHGVTLQRGCWLPFPPFSLVLFCFFLVVLLLFLCPCRGEAVRCSWFLLEVIAEICRENICRGNAQARYCRAVAG